jgi:hypothetical protein
MDVLVNTPTHTWVYTRAEGFQESEEEIPEIRNSIDTGSSSNQEGSCLYLNKNTKWVMNNLTEKKCKSCIIKISIRS